MRRQPEHVIQFLFTELGTVGSVDGSQRLVIKGRFMPVQIEKVLRQYIGACLRRFDLSKKTDESLSFFVHALFSGSRIRHLQDLSIASDAPHKGKPYLLYDV
jgi:hypothetical protein